MAQRLLDDFAASCSAPLALELARHRQAQQSLTPALAR